MFRDQSDVEQTVNLRRPEYTFVLLFLPGRSKLWPAVRGWLWTKQNKTADFNYVLEKEEEGTESSPCSNSLVSVNWHETQWPSALLDKGNMLKNSN